MQYFEFIRQWRGWAGNVTQILNLFRFECIGSLFMSFQSNLKKKKTQKLHIRQVTFKLTGYKPGPGFVEKKLGH
jgi:hypothetical protein